MHWKMSNLASVFRTGSSCERMRLVDNINIWQLILPTLMPTSISWTHQTNWMPNEQATKKWSWSSVLFFGNNLSLNKTILWPRIAIWTKQNPQIGRCQQRTKLTQQQLNLLHVGLNRWNKTPCSTAQNLLVADWKVWSDKDQFDEQHQWTKHRPIRHNQWPMTRKAEEGWWHVKSNIKTQCTDQTAMQVCQWLASTTHQRCFLKLFWLSTQDDKPGFCCNWSVGSHAQIHISCVHPIVPMNSSLFHRDKFITTLLPAARKNEVPASNFFQKHKNVVPQKHNCVKSKTQSFSCF